MDYALQHTLITQPQCSTLAVHCSYSHSDVVIAGHMCKLMLHNSQSSCEAMRTAMSYTCPLGRFNSFDTNLAACEAGRLLLSVPLGALVMPCHLSMKLLRKKQLPLPPLSPRPSRAQLSPLPQDRPTSLCETAHVPAQPILSSLPLDCSVKQGMPSCPTLIVKVLYPGSHKLSHMLHDALMQASPCQSCMSHPRRTITASTCSP